MEQEQNTMICSTYIIVKVRVYFEAFEGVLEVIEHVIQKKY